MVIYNFEFGILSWSEGGATTSLPGVAEGSVHSHLFCFQVNNWIPGACQNLKPTVGKPHLFPGPQNA